MFQYFLIIDEVVVVGVIWYREALFDVHLIFDYGHLGNKRVLIGNDVKGDVSD